MMKKLGFGCMRLPTLGANDKVDIPQFSRMVDEFLGHGFTYFDTSYVYHGGKSEDALRQALVERHPRGSFTITTKLPVFLLKERADTRRFFAEQLARLGTDYVDYYWLHALNAASYENAVKLGVFEEVAQLKKEGKIRQHHLPEIHESGASQSQFRHLRFRADRGRNEPHPQA
jgi:predicted aldo/keto reductase-like oxidoreductase